MQSALRSYGVGHSVQVAVENNDPQKSPERAGQRTELLDWICESVVETDRDLAVLVPVVEGLAPIWPKSSDKGQISFKEGTGLTPTKHIKEVSTVLTKIMPKSGIQLLMIIGAVFIMGAQPDLGFVLLTLGVGMWLFYNLVNIPRQF